MSLSESYSSTSSDSYKSDSSDDEEVPKAEPRQPEPDVEIGETEKKNILDQASNLGSSESIIASFPPSKRKSAKKALEENTLIFEVEQLQDFNFVTYNKMHFISWISKQKGFAEWNQNAPANEDERAIFLFKKLLLQNPNELKQTELWELVVPNQLVDLRQSLLTLLAAKPELQRLVRSPFERRLVDLAGEALSSLEPDARRELQELARGIRGFEKIWKVVSEEFALQTAGLATDPEPAQPEEPKKKEPVEDESENKQDADCKKDSKKSDLGSDNDDSESDGESLRLDSTSSDEDQSESEDEEANEAELLSEMLQLIEEECEESKADPHPRVIFGNCRAQLSSRFIEFSKSKWKRFEETDLFLFLLSMSPKDQRVVKRRSAELFFHPRRLSLNQFNQVNEFMAQERGKKHFASLKPPPAPRFGSEMTESVQESKKGSSAPKGPDEAAERSGAVFIESLVDLLMAQVKRRIGFANVLEMLKKVTFLEGYKGLLSARFLATALLGLSEAAVRLRYLENLSCMMAVPLSFSDPQFGLGESGGVEVVREVGHIVLDSVGVLNLELGLAARADLRSAMLLNKLFFTKFEAKRSQLFGNGCVDVNFDHNSDMPRRVSFLHVYGQTTDVSLLEHLEPLVNVLILQISRFDISENPDKSPKRLLQDILKRAKKEKVSVFVVVRDWQVNDRNRQSTENKVKELLKLDEEAVEVLFADEKRLDDEDDLSDIEKHLAKSVNTRIHSFDPDQFKMTRQRFEEHIVRRPFPGEDARLIQSKAPSQLKQPKTESEYIASLAEAKREQKGLYSASIKTVEDFCARVAESIEQNKFKDDFFFNQLSAEKRKLVRSIRNMRQKSSSDPSHKKKILAKEERLQELKQEMQSRGPSDMMREFHRILTSAHAEISLIVLSARLIPLNSSVRNEIQRKIDGLAKAKEGVSDEGEKGALDAQIREQRELMMTSAVSNEVFLRNLHPFLEDNSQWLDQSQKQELRLRILDLLVKGFFIEFIDGNNLEFRLRFLENLLDRLGSSSVYVVSCIGPQSTGKSTLLNFAFGTQFQSSQGRCTSGLYISVQRIAKPGAEYLLIVDTEGLHSEERRNMQGGDPEFDRKVLSLVLKNSDLMLVTLKAELSRDMKRDLAMTLYTANKLKSFKRMPHVKFVFNQCGSNNAETRRAMRHQLAGINDEVRRGMRIFDPESEEKVHTYSQQSADQIVLGNAFKPDEHQADSDLGLPRDVQFKNVSEVFAKKTSELGRDILALIASEGKQKAGICSFAHFIRKANQDWTITDKFVDLSNFSHLKKILEKHKASQFVGESSRAETPNFEGFFETIQSNLMGRLNKIQDAKQAKEFFQKWRADNESQMSQRVEKWHMSVLRQVGGLNLNEDYCIESLNSAKRLFDLEFRKTVSEMKSHARDRVFQIYEQKGPSIIIEGAKRLAGEKGFKSFSPEEREREMDKRFEQMLEVFLKECREDFGSEKVTRELYSAIVEIASKMTHFYPENTEQPPCNYDEVDNERVSRMLQTEFGRPESVIIPESKMRELPFEMDARLKKTSELFMAYKKCVTEKVEIEYFHKVEDAFRLAEFKESFFRELQSEVESGEGDFEMLLSRFDSVAPFGVVFGKPKEVMLRKTIKKCGGDLQNIRKQLERYFDDVKFDETIQVEELPPFVKPFFTVKTKTVRKDKMEKSSKIRYARVISTKYELHREVQDAESKRKLETFLNPFETENQSRISEAMSFVIEKYFQFDALTQDIRLRCEALLHPSTGSASAQFSFNLLKRFIEQDLAQLFAKIDDEIGACAAEMSEILAGSVTHVAMLFLWRFLSEARVAGHKKQFEKLQRKRSEFKQLFREYLSSDGKNKAAILVTNALSDEFGEMLNEKVQRHGRVLKGKLNQLQVTRKMKSAGIMRQLRSEILTPEQPLKRIMRFIEDPLSEMRQKANKIINPIIYEHIKMFEAGLLEELSADLEHPLSVVKHLNKHLVTDLALKDSSVEHYFVDEGESTQNRFRQKKAEFMFEIIHSTIANKAIRTRFDLGGGKGAVKFRLDEKQLREIISQATSLQVHSKKKNLFSESLCPVLEKAFNLVYEQRENKIHSLEVFFLEIIDHLEKELRRVKELSFSSSELKLDNVIENFKMMSIGCTAKCPHCGVKCEHPDSFPHRHHADEFGHNLRVFKNEIIAKGNLQLPSKIPCDFIDPDRIMDQKSLGAEMTWAQIMARNPSWRISLKKDAQNSPNVQILDRLWIRHGEEICKQMRIQNDPDSVAKCIDKCNLNELRKSVHYMFLVDTSYSMFSLWKKSKLTKSVEAMNDFLRTLRTFVNEDLCYVSLIYFYRQADVIESFKPLRQVSSFKQGGYGFGDNYSKPLKEALKIILDNRRVLNCHKIFMYSDGQGGYPKRQVNQFIGMLRDGFDIKLHLITDRNVSRESTFAMMQKELPGHCTINENVIPERLAEKFNQVYHL